MCVWHRRAQRPLQGGALAISSSNTSPCSLATKADLFSKHDQQIGKDEGGVRSHFECKKWIEIGFLATNLDRYPSNSSTKKPLIQLSSIHPFFTFALSSPKGPKLESSPEMSKSLPWNFEVVTSADLPACFLASLLIRSQVWPMWKGSLGRFGEMAKWVHNNSVLEFPTHYGSSTTRSGFVSFSVFFFHGVMDDSNLTLSSWPCFKSSSQEDWEIMSITFRIRQVKCTGLHSWSLIGRLWYILVGFLLRQRLPKATHEWLTMVG